MQFIEFSMNIYLDGRLWRARARFVFLGECRVLKFEKFGCCFWGKFPKKPVRGLRRPPPSRIAKAHNESFC